MISATWLGKCLPKVASGGSGAMGEPWGSGVGSGVWDGVWGLGFGVT